MRKFFMMLSIGFMVCIGAYAQKEVTVKAGTPIPFQVVNGFQASDVELGEKVGFRVARDVLVDGQTAIPYGTLASGKVIVAKKSSWWGTRGRLEVGITELVMPNGTVIPIENGNCKLKGKNRTTLSVILFCFITIPACFICGGKAEMPQGYEIQTNVAANTTLKID